MQISVMRIVVRIESSPTRDYCHSIPDPTQTPIIGPALSRALSRLKSVSAPWFLAIAKCRASPALKPVCNARDTPWRGRNRHHSAR